MWLDLTIVMVVVIPAILGMILYWEHNRGNS